MIYQRPGKIPKDMKKTKIDIEEKTHKNYLIAKLYQEKTKYEIITEQGEINTANNLFRILYPIDILIELSKIVGNPIAPYYDNEKYRITIESNILAFANSIKNIEI